MAGEYDWLRTDMNPETLNQDMGGWGGDGDRGPQRFYMKPKEERTVLFLTDDLPGTWEVSWGEWNKALKKKTWGHRTTLHRRNGIEGPDLIENLMRDHQNYPYFMGWATIIDLTGYTTKKGKSVKFIKSIYAAKAGSEEKPGILRRLFKMRQTRNGLVGAVFQITREGDKSETCGNVHEFIEKVPPDQWASYLRGRGCELDDDKMAELLTPIDFRSLYAPLGKAEYGALYDHLRVVLGGEGGEGGGGGGSSANSAGAASGEVSYEGVNVVDGGASGNGGDDDIPF